MSAFGAQTSAAPRVRRLQPSRGRFPLDLRELWSYRELFFFLGWRDIKVRYKQTSLGIAWAILQPFTAMVIFSVVFGHLAGIQGAPGVPYPLFVYAGLLPWQYFASSLGQSSGSVVGGSALVTKVYFPRLLLPLASVGVPVVDFLFSFVVLLGMFAWYGRAPSWHFVFVPFLLVAALLTAFGIGLCFAALNVRYRDVRYIVPYITQIWLYVTPVIYPVSLFPGRFHWLIALNPMTGVVDGFRWAILGQGGPAAWTYLLSLSVGAGFVLLGVRVFKRAEERFADII